MPSVATPATASSMDGTIDNMLPKGLEPEQVCEEVRSRCMDFNCPHAEATQYFKACNDKDNERWLACLHVRRRATATSKQPGPFAVCNWDLGRARVEKYMVKYQYTGNSSDGGLRNAEPVLILEYQPMYGPVPGYQEGSALGEPIQMVLQKQGGRDGQWRVMDGAF